MNGKNPLYITKLINILEILIYIKVFLCREWMVCPHFCQYKVGAFWVNCVMYKFIEFFDRLLILISKHDICFHSTKSVRWYKLIWRIHWRELGQNWHHIVLRAVISEKMPLYCKILLILEVSYFPLTNLSLHVEKYLPYTHNRMGWT